MWRILAPPLLGLPFGALPAVLVVFSARALAMISSLLECPQKNTRNTDTRKRLDENRSPPSARPAGAAGTGCGPKRRRLLQRQADQAGGRHRHRAGLRPVGAADRPPHRAP